MLVCQMNVFAVCVSYLLVESGFLSTRFEFFFVSGYFLVSCAEFHQTKHLESVFLVGFRVWLVQIGTAQWTRFEVYYQLVGDDGR